MSRTNELLRRVGETPSIAVYNGTGADIAEGVACAFDPENPPTSTRATGIKITTGDSDFLGMTYTLIKAGQSGSLQLRGVGIGVAGADITFGDTLSVMSNSSGELIPRTSGKRTAGIPTISALTGETVSFLIETSNAT